MNESRPHVVIIGGGFGGLNAARALCRVDVDVTVIDKTNHHLFQPLLYQVATAALDAGHIAYPIRSALRRQRNATVLLAEARRIDLQRRTVVLERGEVEYDYLVIAAGARYNYFGNDEWADLAPGLKTLDDAMTIRRRIFLALEAAERESDPERQRQWLTFVLVGAGPTGVEMAGTIADIGRNVVKRDFRNIDPEQVRVVLVEGIDRVLSAYEPRLSDSARRQLEELGVEVRLESMVTRVDDHGVCIGDERIDAHTVVWAAGVRAAPLAESLDVARDKQGRILVNDDLSLPRYPEVFAIGDIAQLASGAPMPGVAPAAIQGGKHVGRCVRADLRGEDRPRFVYRDKGSLSTIGRAAAVAQFDHIRLSGFFAWVLWWAVHIFFLIGFRNRIAVIFNWIWEYVTFQRGSRIIMGDGGELSRRSLPRLEVHRGGARRAA